MRASLPHWPPLGATQKEQILVATCGVVGAAVQPSAEHRRGHCAPAIGCSFASFCWLEIRLGKLDWTVEAAQSRAAQVPH